jgi:hypothetical protein
MVNFTPEGLAADFFGTLARHAPQPPGEPSPLAWGAEAHVRDLFGDRVSSLDLTRREYVERWPGGPLGYVELFRATFGPVIALYALLEGTPAGEALDADFREFAVRANRGAAGGPAEYAYEILQVVATRA